MAPALGRMSRLSARDSCCSSGPSSRPASFERFPCRSSPSAFCCLPGLPAPCSSVPILQTSNRHRLTQPGSRPSSNPKQKFKTILVLAPAQLILQYEPRWRTLMPLCFQWPTALFVTALHRLSILIVALIRRGSNHLVRVPRWVQRGDRMTGTSRRA